MGHAFFCDLSFVCHGVVVMDLAWDPDRYDSLSDTRIFAVTWCLWNWTDLSYVIIFSYLDISDLHTFCCTSYCIYIDFTDILDELESYRRSLRDVRS